MPPRSRFYNSVDLRNPKANYFCGLHGWQDNPRVYVNRTAVALGKDKGVVRRSCPVCRVEQDTARRQALRLAAIKAYGGRCACCRTDIPEFLLVNYLDRRSPKWKAERGSRSLYAWLKKAGYPPHRFQVLCGSCDLAIGTWPDIRTCPHWEQKETPRGEVPKPTNPTDQI